MDAVTFVDVETTGLGDAAEELRTGKPCGEHVIWEVGLIERRNGRDTEFCAQIRLTKWELDYADPTALEVGRYYERPRMPRGPEVWVTTNSALSGQEGGYGMSKSALVDYLVAALDGQVFAASNPPFDQRFVNKLLAQFGRVPNYHYRPVCVEALAAGKLGVRPPWKADELFALLGVDLSRYERHTGLGDVRLDRDVYDLVYGAGQF